MPRSTCPADLGWASRRALTTLSGARSKSACLFYFFSNSWRIFGRLWEARSRLYRSQILQVKLVWKLLTRSTWFTHVWTFWIQSENHVHLESNLKNHLHRSENSAKCRQAFPHFCSLVLKNSLIFASIVQNSPMLMNCFRNFSNFYGDDKNLLDYQIS